MEEMILRAGRGAVYFALAYFGMKLLGVPTSKAIVISFAPLIAGLTNLFSRELGLLAMLCLLLGLANYATEGKITSLVSDIYEQVTTDAGNSQNTEKNRPSPPHPQP